MNLLQAESRANANNSKIWSEGLWENLINHLFHSNLRLRRTNIKIYRCQILNPKQDISMPNPTIKPIPIRAKGAGSTNRVKSTWTMLNLLFLVEEANFYDSNLCHNNKCNHEVQLTCVKNLWKEMVWKTIIHICDWPAALKQISCPHLGKSNCEGILVKRSS